MKLLSLEHFFVYKSFTVEELFFLLCKISIFLSNQDW